MIALFVEGLVTGLVLILAIGAQNVFIIKQGLTGGAMYTAALVSATCDTVLIFVGIYGLAFIAEYVPEVKAWTLYLGIAFLVVYGVASLRNGLRANPKGWQEAEEELQGAEEKFGSVKKKTLALALFFSLLNPHVYLDTMVVLGGIGADKPGNGKLLFGLGAGLASYIWFLGTGLAATVLAPFMKRERWLRRLDISIGVVILVLAINLLRDAMAG